MKLLSKIRRNAAGKRKSLFPATECQSVSVLTGQSWSRWLSPSVHLALELRSAFQGLGLHPGLIAECWPSPWGPLLQADLRRPDGGAVTQRPGAGTSRVARLENAGDKESPPCWVLGRAGECLRE